MFDKLVESSSTGADLKPRRRIFVASFFFVAVLFVTAVVASIYAADFDLGTDNFDIAQLLSPIVRTEPLPEIEPERTERNQSTQQSTNSELTRQVLMASTDNPNLVPDKISTDINPYASIQPRDYGRVRVTGVDSEPGIPVGNQTGTDRGSAVGPGAGASEEPVTKEPPPAPPKVEKPKPIVSDGVVNGKATYLPKPLYSAAAIAMRAQGKVDVQVTIDETGKVISARAVSGNPLLRVEAEKAAWKAKFTPTYLSKVPVKVTGVIVYNFTR